MRFTWLGQAGLMMETGGTTVLIDPYLSDAVAAIEPKNHRRVPVDERFFAVRPTVILLTHDHADHTDPETLAHYLHAHSDVTVLASLHAWRRVRAFGGDNNYVLFEAGSRFTVGGVCFEALPAAHSDEHAIGALIGAEGRTCYVTGDTLYSERIFAALPRRPIHALFLPINGVGNNMNTTDAAAFSARVGATYTVPLHFGLFDAIDPRAFVCKGRVIPRIYEEIPLP